MEKPLPDQQDYLDASLKTAQYLASLTAPDCLNSMSNSLSVGAPPTGGPKTAV